MTNDAARPATNLAADPTTTRPKAGEEAGVIGGKGAGAYSEALGAGRFALAAPAGKLTARRIVSMREHYQIAACLLVLTLPLVDADSTVECDDPDAAETLSDSWQLKRLDVMRSFAKTLPWGYSPNGLRWNDVQLPSGSAFVVDKIRDLDPQTCQVIEDSASAYAGIRQQPPGSDPVILDNPWQTLWMTNGMENGNLYGRSLLTAALAPWKTHLTVDVWHHRYLERFGEPVVRVRYPDGGEGYVNAEEYNAAQQWNEDHPSDQRPLPELIKVDNQKTAQKLGEGLANHSVIALNSAQAIGPDGKPTGYSWDVDFVESARSGAADFQTKLDAADRSMARALFIPDTLFANPDTGTYALGRQHRSIFDSSTEGRLADAARQISAYIIDRERFYNFGPTCPPARLVFGGVTDVNRDRLWDLAQLLVSGQRLPIDVARLGADLGIPLLSPEEQADADAAAGGGVAASPFATVGLPALITAGILTVDEARALLGLDALDTAPVPDAPPPVDPAATEEALARAHHAVADLLAGRELHAEQRAAVRTALGLSTTRERIELTAPRPGRLLAAGGVGDTSSLPGYAQPQAAADRGAFAREQTRHERRVPFTKIEGALNDAEAQAIDSLVDILGASREAVLRQVAGIMGKPTKAEQLEAIATLDLKLGNKVTSVWEGLIRSVWATGLTSVQAELAAVSADVAAKVPTGLGPEARAVAKVQATSASEAQAAKLLGGIRAQTLNAVRSGVGRAGVEALVSAAYERETNSEAATPRLSTRTLSAQALNGGRVDAVERGGVRLRGAQYSALLDRSTCELCERLDEQVIAIENTDLARFTPPVHHNCRCVWVWITDEELDFTPTWTGAPVSLVDANGGLVLG